MRYISEEKRNFLKEFKNGQKLFGENISVIINSILLSLIYFIGVGLTSGLSKIFRKKFLELEIDKSKDTYWTNLKLNKTPIEDYYRQF